MIENMPTVFKDDDSLLRMTLMGGQMRVSMCRVTRATQQAADIHKASDVATSAMGRLLAAGGLMTADLEEPAHSITLIVDGNGAGGRMTLVARPQTLKVTVDQPQVDLPLNAYGRQDVTGFVGREGKLSVVRDIGKGEPHIGISRLVTGELGQDFAEYFTMSEQRPSLVALGCLNQAGKVLSCGGILIQAMPDCDIRTIEQIELREPFFRGISREIYDRSLRELAEGWFEGLEPVFLEETPLRLQCDCSLERMEMALKALSREELQEIAEEGKDTEMLCHFCRSRHLITPGRVRALLEEKEG